MKDLLLQIRKWDTPKEYYLQDYCTTIKLSNSFSQIAAELSFELPYATLSSNLLAINIEMGDVVSFYYKTVQIFAGKVIDTNLKGKKQTLSVSCYDYCWWIVKSNITKNFNNISVQKALQEVYDSIGASYDIDYALGSNGDIMINSHLVKAKPASKVLYAIYSEVTKATKAKGSGVYYYMHIISDKSIITITEADKYFSGLTIQAPTSLKTADGNLIDYEINESMQNMITKVSFYKTTGEEYDESDKMTLTTNTKRFGIIQENVEVADDDTNATKALLEGQKLLDEKSKPSEELTVTCFGSIDYKVAYGVLVKIPNTNYYDRFMYIVSSEWIWNKDGTFISKLTLSPSKNRNLEDWTTIEEKQDDSTTTTTGSSDLVNRIIVELKKYLGLAYKWGGESPAAGGMDCSGYISYVYNQFSSELEIKSNDGKFHVPTQSMMSQGKDVTSDFPDNLKECDIVFPHSGHVQAYVGDGKVIHSPQTGDVIKISDLNRSKIAKVIRVVPDSAWSSKISGGNVNTDGSLDSAVNCTTEKEFGDMVYKYARGLFKTYHIFPGVIISCMLQESWINGGFTKLAKNHFNIGGVKCSASSQDAVHDYKPPASEGSMLYRNFNSLKDFMIYWCKLISGQTGMSVYKREIADKNTPKEQILGFNNTPYAGDKTKGQQMLGKYNQNNFSKYDEGL